MAGKNRNEPLALIDGLLQGPSELTSRVRLAARRARGRLELEQAAELLGSDVKGAAAGLERAEREFVETLQAAEAGGDFAESTAACRDRVAVGAAREDLDGVIDALTKLRELAKRAELVPVLFEAVEDLARALRFRRDLSAARGELQELHALRPEESLRWAFQSSRATACAAIHCGRSARSWPSGSRRLSRQLREAEPVHSTST